MKRLLIASMVFISTCLASGNKVLPGEHLNGRKYECYSGPAEVQQPYLDRVDIALEAYAKENAEDVLSKVLGQSRGKKWIRVDFEYVTSEKEGSAPVKIRIGVRYAKGDMQCVVYENQVMIAFSVASMGGRLDKMYYLSGEQELRVTHAYTL